MREYIFNGSSLHNDNLLIKCNFIIDIVFTIEIPLAFKAKKMAHKHNRRRVRPRVRPGRQDYHNNFMSYETLSLRPQVVTSQTASNRPIPMRGCQILQHVSDITDPYHIPSPAKSFGNQYLPKTMSDVESERIKMFGGEPGESSKDDISLCFKMVEAFEGMDWVNV